MPTPLPPRALPATVRRLRRWLLLVALVCCCSLLASACTDAIEPESTELESDEPSKRAPTKTPRRYRAEWVLDAGAAGRTEPGYPYIYAEVIDDVRGQYMVQTATHLATQSREASAICADIFREDGRVSCASIPRPDGVPDVASIAITRLRDWSPAGVFEIVGPRSIEAAAAEDPDSWVATTGEHRTVPVRCWTVVAQTPSAPLGFHVCFTADGNNLVASLDLTGDELLEVDLQLYSADVPESTFEIGFDLVEDATVYEQLVFIFPQLPVGEDALTQPGGVSTSDG